MRQAMLICDVWSDHWCKSIRERTATLAQRIEPFASRMRAAGVQIIHCPSETVDRYYADWWQRRSAKMYPYRSPPISEMPREFLSPLETYKTNGCPDEPKCFFQTEFIEKQHPAISIHDDDLITDSGQEVANVFAYNGIESAVVTGTALNMCLLGRPYGIIGLQEMGATVTVVSDLVEIAYSPAEPPSMTHEKALRKMLSCVVNRWCPAIDSESILRSVE